VRSPEPDTRIVELRVHGVLGASPESLVDAVAAVDVAGDGTGRLVRPADRVRRPSPGPVLRTGGRTVPRTVEGYVWGRMTSGNAAKAAWALLFPFTLANVAHWMLPPAPATSRTAQSLGVLLRALNRLAALLLTVLLVVQVTVVSLDMLAAQCLAPTTDCMPGVPEAVRGSALLRSLCGLLPVALVVVAMHRVASVDWKVRGDHRPPSPTPQLAQAPGASVVADPDTPALRALHTTAALAAPVLLGLGGPTGPDRPLTAPLWWISVLLLGVSIVGVLLLDDPTATGRNRTGVLLRRALGRIPRRVLIGTGALVLTGTALLPGELGGPLPGSDTTVLAVAGALALCCTVFAVLLAPAALLARREWVALPRELRPWAGGWMAAPVLALAALLGGGFGAGVALTVQHTLQRPDLVLPDGYHQITLLWGAAAVLGAVVAVVAVPTLLATRYAAERRGRFIPPEVTLLHGDHPEDAEIAARRWWWADLQRRYVHRLLLAVVGLLCGGAVLTVTTGFVTETVPSWARWISGVGVVTLASLAVGLLRAVYLAARQPETGRRLGLLADLASFWPREAHPTVPPSYALKVVPELANRALEHLKHPGVRVVLVGHSQGSLLATVATARLLQILPPVDRERVGLVTAGSQLQWAYPRAFPAVVPHSSLAALTGQLRGRWRSLCRGTDPLGGAVSTWSRQVYGGKLLGVGYRADGTAGPLPPAGRSSTGALVLGGDHWLPDPRPRPSAGRRWSPGVLGHSDYYADPEWDRVIAIAAGLESPPEPLEPLVRAVPQPRTAGGADRRKADDRTAGRGTQKTGRFRKGVRAAKNGGSATAGKAGGARGGAAPNRASALSPDQVEIPPGPTPWERGQYLAAQSATDPAATESTGAADRDLSTAGD